MTALHDRFCQWGYWVRTRRLVVPIPRLKSAAAIPLTPRGRSEGPQTFLDPDCADLHQRILRADDADRLLVTVEFVLRPAKSPRVTARQVAAHLGISRASYYRTVAAAMDRIATS
jgi:hypothetical protein